MKKGISSFLLMVCMMLFIASAALADQPAYVEEHPEGYLRVWGEDLVNVSDSLVYEMYTDDGKLMATTEWISVFDFNSWITWSFYAPDGGDKANWATTWEPGYPSADVKPARIVTYEDGQKTTEYQVQMTSPDNLSNVVWEDLINRLNIIPAPDRVPAPVVEGDVLVSSDVPQTGDNSSLMLWAGMLALAAVGFAVSRKTRLN